MFEGNLTDAGQRRSLPEGLSVVVVTERELGVHVEQSGVDGVEETRDGQWEDDVGEGVAG